MILSRVRDPDYSDLMGHRKSSRERMAVWTALSLALLLPVVIVAVQVHIPRDYASCHDCFCIPDEEGVCPLERAPRTDFNDLTPKLRAIHHENPIVLSCDPYDDDECDTEPPLEQGGACVIDYSFQSANVCPTNYSLHTYDGTLEEAYSSGMLVTHAGPCGACSSLQDLAAYMEQGADLRSMSSKCGFRGWISQRTGVNCFMSLGFTESCATAWYYNTKNTGKYCVGLCMRLVMSGRPPNRNDDTCSMETCIECDETHSGPLFKKYSGRTRRNSGLRSNIARLCSEMTHIEHQDPCVASNTTQFSTGEP